MPVDQSGENILFVLDGKTVEAHVQIQYQGSAERFAWIVPMQDVPEVTIGSQPLFTRLLGATVPTYALQTQVDQCGAGGSGTGGSTSFGGSGGGSGAGGSGGSGGTQVVYEKVVGAFQVVVLKGGTAVEVVDWLKNNNYQNIPTAPSILQDYVSKNYVFVAIKLTGGAGLDEIHPLVFEYPGNEPCVPLKLTRVAATEDMAVRAFFLAQDRAVPVNYKHVTLNPARLNWLSLGSNYKQAVTFGVDSAVANGHAFVTEYAGTSSTVPQFGIWSSAWNAAAFQSIAPENVVTTLTQQLLMWCGSNQCVYQHPLIAGILADYLPIPAGMTDYQFYGCLSCNLAKIDQTKWNAAEFAATLKQRIVDPGAHAKALLDTWPYLTRLYTTISPAEMTEDPIFRAAPGEPPVDPSQIATQRIACNGQRALIFPDQREMALDGTGLPPWDSLMPWAEKIEEYPPVGSKITLVDNTKKINARLAEWNGSQGWPPTSASGGGGGTSGSGGASAGGGGFSGGGFGGGNGGSANGEGEVNASGGGGCVFAARASGCGGFSVAGLGLLALALRRRRKLE